MPWTDSRCWKNSDGAQTVYGPWPPLPDPRQIEHEYWNVAILAPMVFAASSATFDPNADTKWMTRQRRFRRTARRVRREGYALSLREARELREFGIEPRPLYVPAWEEIT